MKTGIFNSKPAHIHGWVMPADALVSETEGHYQKKILYFTGIDGKMTEEAKGK